MGIISSAIALIVLGIVYRRMIGREVPEPISKKQAVVPVVLGAVALFLSTGMAIGYSYILMKAGFAGMQSIENLFVRSIVSAFVGAGFPEEIAKLVMMLICFKVFKPKNVYEYILIGFGVGMGATINEEFAYGTTEGLLIGGMRLLTLGLHCVFNVYMGKYLGLAKHDRQNDRNTATKNTVLAIVIPLLLHTIYDAATVKNAAYQAEGNEAVQFIGLIIALIVCVVFTVGQVVVLKRFGKQTEHYCDLKISQDA